MQSPEEDTEDVGMDEENFDDEDDEGGYIDTGSLLASVLMTEEGDTVCSALVSIAKQLEMQNKIMVKILTQLSKKST